MDNKELIQKAIITTDAIAAAGKLNPKQADKFLNQVIDITALKGKVRIETFRPEEMYIDKINIGRRVAMPKAEASAVSVRRNVTTSRIKLNPSDIVVPFEISSNFISFNIEGDAGEDLVIRMMATALANDTEELAVSGDKLGPAVVEADLYDDGSATDVVTDSYLKLVDGWLKLLRSGHVVDAATANISSTIFSSLIKAIPDKWKRVRKNMKYFCSTDHEQNYRQTVSSRATAAGDVALSSMNNLTPFGIELVPVPLLQTRPLVVEHLTLTGTTAENLFSTNITDAVVTLTTLGNNPTTPLTSSDVVVDATAGTVARAGGSSLSDPVDVKVTYRSLGQMMCTEYRNLVWALNREVRILKDSDIYKDTAQYAIHTSQDVVVEEADATSLCKNLGLD